jgi:hypothetical protein
VKKFWGHLLLAVTIGFLFSTIKLTYFLWRYYQELQASNASGSEYIGFLFAPGLYLFCFLMALLSFVGYQKLTGKHTVVGDIMGLLLVLACALSIMLIVVV